MQVDNTTFINMFYSMLYGNSATAGEAKLDIVGVQCNLSDLIPDKEL